MPWHWPITRKVVSSRHERRGQSLHLLWSVFRISNDVAISHYLIGLYDSLFFLSSRLTRTQKSRVDEDFEVLSYFTKVFYWIINLVASVYRYKLSFSTPSFFLVAVYLPLFTSNFAHLCRRYFLFVKLYPLALEWPSIM